MKFPHKSSYMLAGSFLGLILVAGAGAIPALGAASHAQASANEAKHAADLPLAGTKLPFRPSFVPGSAEGYVFQSYDYGNWHYRVQYFYNRQAGRWLFGGYSAQLLRLPDGTPVHANASAVGAVSNANLSFNPNTGPCPTPAPGVIVNGDNSHKSGAVHPHETICNIPQPPPPGTVPPPTGRGTPHEQVTHKIVGRYWTVKATYTWLQNRERPRGAWYRTYRNVTRTKNGGGGNGGR